MISTGNRNMDNLLQGGIPETSSVLFYGPPFIGKEVLARRIAAKALNGGVPVMWVSTKDIEDDVRVEVQRCGAKDIAELRIIDTVSRSIDADEADDNAVFVDSGMDLNGIAVAIGRLQAELLAKHPSHLMVVDSLSTLVAYTKATTVFRFLQIMLGRAERAGATSLLLMDHGMHSDAEMKMFQHIMAGSLEFKSRGSAPSVHAEGLNIRGDSGWVEYEFTDTDFRLTGLVATERIV